MKLNIHGKTLYEVGDIVMLATQRPSNWSSSGDMDMYLGNVVTLTAVVYRDRDSTDPCGQIAFSGSGSWTFRTDEIMCIATPEIVEEYRQKRERELAEFKEKFKTFVIKPEQVYAIAKDIFGEEYVDMKVISPTDFDILVWFPEINLTNSRDKKHVIKDLYVKINVDITVQNVNTGDRLSSIILSGRRGTLSEEEYHSSYGHSHFSGRGIERWSDFCLGTSDFAMILHTMKFSLTAEDWSLLFLSLENYVSWESLEGGPYRRISDIRVNQQNMNTSNFISHALELIKTLPNACLTLNDGKIEFNTDHPALMEHYMNASRIRTFRADGSTSFTSTQVSFNRFVSNECAPFTFKERAILPVLYKKNVQTVTAEEMNIDQDVIDFYNRTINKELKKYNISYEYNKVSTTSTIFGEASPF